MYLFSYIFRIICAYPPLVAGRPQRKRAKDSKTLRISEAFGLCWNDRPSLEITLIGDHIKGLKLRHIDAYRRGAAVHEGEKSISCTAAHILKQLYK